MALATDQDVIKRLRRPLSDAETQSIDVDLQDASDVVLGYCRADWETPEEAPTAARGVVAKMIARSYRRGDNTDGMVDQRTAGPFTTHYAAATTTGDFWLTNADKLALRKCRTGGGMTSVPLVSERGRDRCEDDES